MTDRRLVGGARLPALVRDTVAAGVDWVQVRERDLGGAALLDLVDRVLEAAREGAATRGGPVRVLVNRRVDVALAASADGAHLGFDALPPGRARGVAGPGARLGVSAHAPAEVAEAARDGADYAHLAPVFEPLSKPAGRPALGPAALTAAAGAGIPVLAQGGVSADRVETLLAAGAAGVAVTGAILSAPDPVEATRALRGALDRAARGAHPC